VSRPQKAANGQREAEGGELLRHILLSTEENTFEAEANDQRWEKTRSFSGRGRRGVKGWRLCVARIVAAGRISVWLFPLPNAGESVKSTREACQNAKTFRLSMRRDQH